MKNNAKAFLIEKERTVKDAMRQMSDFGQKELFVVDGEGILFGVLSDGDVRRWILNEGDLGRQAGDVCNRSPKTLCGEWEEDAVKKMMLEYRIESVPVLAKDGRIEQVLLWDEVFAGKVPKHRGTMDIPVVIMAGGKGTRLDPFTKILPKPLIPIGERPIIEIIMDKFIEYGTPIFYISVFHKARMIKSYFEETNGKYKIEFLEEQKPLGTIGSLGLLKNRFQQEVMVTNCDVIIDTDYTELLQFHRAKKYDLTLVASMRHYKIPYGVCELAPGGALVTIKEKPEYDLLVNTGMYVISQRAIDIIPDDQSYTVIDLIKDMKAKSLSIGAFPITEKSWIDVGQWEEYAKSVQDLEKKAGTL